MKKVRYVQLEPMEVILDYYNSGMTAEQFGCYWLLIIYLYCNNGRVELDLKKFAALCKYPENFEKVWEKIESKFQKNGKFIKQKRVTSELREARRRMKVAAVKGLKGAQARWHRHSTGNACSIAKERKRNEREVKERKVKETEGKETEVNKTEYNITKPNQTEQNLGVTRIQEEQEIHQDDSERITQKRSSVDSDFSFSLSSISARSSASADTEPIPRQN